MKDNSSQLLNNSLTNIFLIISLSLNLAFKTDGQIAGTNTNKYSDISYITPSDTLFRI